MSLRPDTDTTYRQPMEPTIDAAAVMAAVAAADAVVTDPSKALPSATHGEAHA